MSKFAMNSQVKETSAKRMYPTEIIAGNKIEKVEYIPEHDCLDISFSNNEYYFRERMFNPIKGTVPEWTTEEKEINKFLSRVKQIMCRFMSEADASFEADTFEEMAAIVADKLTAASEGKTFDLKFIFDKKFEYPILGMGRFIRVEGEPALQYTKWEKENRLINEAAPAVESGVSDLF